MEIFLQKVKKKSSNELGHWENFIWSESMCYITHSNLFKKQMLRIYKVKTKLLNLLEYFYLLFFLAKIVHMI